MFSNLLGKIFAHASTPAPTTQATVASNAPTPAPDSAPAADAAPPAADPALPSAGVPTASAASPAPAAPQNVDVAAILSDLAAKSSEKLDWKRSIVDMLKLLDMDSSLSARKELAKELSYPGDENDSAAMNEWLHPAVMKKIAENGGKVPAELLG